MCTLVYTYLHQSPRKYVDVTYGDVSQVTREYLTGRVKQNAACLKLARQERKTQEEGGESTVVVDSSRPSVVPFNSVSTCVYTAECVDRHLNACYQSQAAAERLLHCLFVEAIRAPPCHAILAQLFQL